MTFNSSNAGKYEGLLNTDLVFEALSKGIAVEVAEINTNDWTVLNPSSQLNFADFFSGFLQFRAVKRGEHFEKTLHKNKASTAYSEFLNLDPKGNERYRVGTKNPFIYVLVKRPIKHDDGIFELREFDIYKEQSLGVLGQIVDRQKAPSWLIQAIYKARNAYRNFEHNQRLEDLGHFASSSYRDYKRQYGRKN
ncbi:hypothetical protein U2E72_13265 [Acinetobacter baumannii]|uniref:hypothetical protein n=1 Tax=Acinetobacter baumannii TaxID=470 RepID=UPI000893E436|nr:hypothetical protein [Acinetobacter baumannii]EKV1658215.1 hypothetical protein [Acinetobacter baumannii]EKV1847126.1 hypothetical protein [Acinetobacter baumannii]EKV4645669.1 hypothetical protein [Acinetobacter baumannii]MBF6833676.1 hypothetical protein [Acinetobacter baumannii]MDK3064872.1 hypothetical protein [Acinetobacter baumannii]